MTRPDWPVWMPPRFAVVLGRGLAEPDMVTAGVVSIHEDVSQRPPWQDEILFGDRFDFSNNVRLAVRAVRYDEPTHADLDWLREVPGYRTTNPTDVELSPRSYYPPIMATWIGNRYGLAFTNRGEEIWIRAGGRNSGTTLGEIAAYPAVLYAWLSRHPQTPPPDHIQIHWLNNHYGSSYVKIEVVRTPFDRLLEQASNDTP